MKYKQIEGKIAKAEKVISVVNDGSYETIDGVLTSKLEDTVNKKKELVALSKELDKTDNTVGEYRLTEFFILVVDMDLQYREELSAYIKLDESITGMIYEHYIGSHSGMNEWALSHVASAYDLLSGNSGFNHAFGTRSFTELLDKFTELTKASEVKKAVRSITEWFATDLGQIVVKEIDGTVKNMKEATKSFD